MRLVGARRGCGPDGRVVEWQGLSFDTPPGTKLAVRNAKVRNGVLLLDRQSCGVKGGQVPALLQDWEQLKVLLPPPQPHPPSCLQWLRCSEGGVRAKSGAAGGRRGRSGE